MCRLKKNVCIYTHTLSPLYSHENHDVDSHMIVWAYTPMKTIAYIMYPQYIYIYTNISSLYSPINPNISPVYSP